MEELRFYCFVNYYLSPIQQGIQAGHCAVDLVKADLGPRLNEVVEQWATDHKTFIVLNGGNHQSLCKTANVLARLSDDFASAEFYEDEDSLGGLLTCVGVVLPKSIFSAEIYTKLVWSNQQQRVMQIQSVPPRQPIGFVTLDEDGDIIEQIGVDHKYFELIKILKSSKLA